MGPAMRIILFLLALLFAAPVAAASYAKPAGVPEIYLADWNKTIAVFAVTSPVGAGLAVFERQADGTYMYCGICIRFDTELASQIAFKGGARGYIEAMAPDINDILAFQYPVRSAAGPAKTPVDQLNAELAGFVLRVVNGVPVFAPR